MGTAFLPLNDYALLRVGLSRKNQKPNKVCGYNVMDTLTVIRFFLQIIPLHVAFKIKLQLKLFL